VIIEAVRKFIEAVRKIIEAVRKIIEAVRLFVKAVRVLRSSANKSIPIDLRLRNNCLSSRFNPVKFRALFMGSPSVSRAALHLQHCNGLSCSV
jgi:hypothetical protein